MALTKKDKIKLVEDYKALLKDVSSVIVLSYNGIPVGETVLIRKQLKSQGALYKVVKKKVFARAVQDLGYEVDLSKLSSSIAVLFANGEGIENLKVFESFKKKWKKEKSSSSIEYLGGWFNGEWKDADYVIALAKLPSKEELVGKFMYMIKYPIQGFVTANSNVIGNFVRVLDQIAKK